MCALPVGKLPASLLRQLLADLPVDDDVLVGPGIGRDAAAIRVGDQVLVLKTDPITFPTNDAGWYLVNINANDIACMGAEPRWLLVTALLPEAGATPDLVEALFSSLRDGCQQTGCVLIGGHTEITEGLDRPILVGQMVGVTTQERLIDPTTARPGDAVLLIGGIAVEGTSILATDASERLAREIDPDVLESASNFARSPGISVLRYARRLAEQVGGNIKAMHDPTEGGLATGLLEIAEATELGISVDSAAVHVYEESVAITEALDIDPWGLIASGALLAVVPAEHADRAVESCREPGVPAARIGTLTSDPAERTLIVDGKRESIPVFAVDEIARYFAT